MRTTLAIALLLGCGSFTMACSGKSPSRQHTDDDSGGDGDSGPTDDGPECYTNPTTHVQIINACGDAETITKSPNLPLLNDDGTLPPLPE